MSVFIEELVRKETAALALTKVCDDAHASAPSFLAVPLETVGKRVDHNADIAAAMISYAEERTKNLQRVLKEMRKRSPAIPVAREFSGGSLERVLAELNRIHEV